MPNRVRRSSRINEMKPSHLTQLCTILDVDRSWRELVGIIKDRYGELMFDNTQIMDIDQKCRYSGNSPTRVVLMNWSTNNPNLADLEENLAKIGHYRAADFVHSTVLGMPGQAQRLQNVEAGGNNVQPHENSNPRDNQPMDHGHSDGFEMHLEFPTDETPDVTSQPSLDDSGLSSLTVVKQLPDSMDDATDHVSVGDTDEIHILKTQPLREQDFDHMEDEPQVKGVHNFSLDFLRNSTGNFNKVPVEKGGHLLGEGGFGKVYKGHSEGYPLMAVKCFNQDVVREEETLARTQFETEISVLAGCIHENLLQLIGFCLDAEWCIVYKFMPNGSLEDRLACQNNTAVLSVSRRLTIAQEVARGLDYLHSSTPPLIHRDIKSANVLLDKDLTAKIGDCGTVRLGPKTSAKTHTVTRAAIGTQPYMPSEYLENGEVSAKLDAYSYGVVLLELLTGLAPCDDNREDRFLMTHVEETLEEEDDNIYGIVDQKVTWNKPLVMEVFRMYRRFSAHKRKRKTISEMLPQIELWTEGFLDSKC